jgi:hypothetical protein
MFPNCDIAFVNEYQKAFKIDRRRVSGRWFSVSNLCQSTRISSPTSRANSGYNCFCSVEHQALQYKRKQFV